MGASAGGLEPLSQLLEGLSSRPGLAVVIVQHLDPHYESQLSSILQTHTPLRVVDAMHGQRVQPDHVYVIRPNTQVAIADGVLSVAARPDRRQPHYPVDHFLRSLATVQGPYAAGVILSGTGSDGTLGIGEILELPIEQSARSAAHDDSDAASPVASARSLRILVADDNEDSRDMMRSFLESDGHTVATAGDGPSALIAVAEFQPDVAILDIGMPGLNGYAVAAQLRHAPRHQSLMLVALSGLGQEEDTRRAAEAGFDVHFTKPVDIPALNKLLASIASERSGRPLEPDD